MIQEKALVMNFDYTETQHMVAAAARDFAEQYIRPFIMEWRRRNFSSGDF